MGNAADATGGFPASRLTARYALYAAHYSTVRLRELAGKIKGSRHGDL